MDTNHAGIVSRISALTVGSLCEGGECRPFVVRWEGWVDAADAWGIGYHCPVDPLIGDSASGEEGGDGMLRRWRTMADIGFVDAEES